MANKTKTVSINEFEKMLLDNTPIEREFNGVKFFIKKYLSLEEMASLVSFVYTSCIDEDTGEYTPEAYQFALRAGMIEHYTNLRLPADIKRKYRLVYETPVFNEVEHNCDEDQYSDILRTIQDKIDFALDMLTSSAVARISEVIEKFNNIGDATEKMFSGVDIDEMQKVIEAIPHMSNFNEEALAKAILKARE